ncbi:MAG: hypothetical protein V1495_05950 [Pseudomonadota bacterium]
MSRLFALLVSAILLIPGSSRASIENKVRYTLMGGASVTAFALLGALVYSALREKPVAPPPKVLPVEAVIGPEAPALPQLPNKSPEPAK